MDNEKEEAKCPVWLSIVLYGRRVEINDKGEIRDENVVCDLPSSDGVRRQSDGEDKSRS